VLDVIVISVLRPQITDNFFIRLLVPSSPRLALDRVPPHRRAQDLVRHSGLARHRLLHGHEAALAHFMPKEAHLAASGYCHGELLKNFRHTRIKENLLKGKAKYG